MFITVSCLRKCMYALRFYSSFSLTFYSVFVVHCMHLSVRLFFLLLYIWTLSSEINELID